jgi:hypothetical protein
MLRMTYPTRLRRMKGFLACLSERGPAKKATIMAGILCRNPLKP